MAPENGPGYSVDAEWNQLYIDGDWCESDSSDSLAVENPSTRATVSRVPRGNEADVNAAYTAVERAQETWAQTPPHGAKN